MKQPRSAAAVVLTRKKPHLEVFWVKRSPQLAFQGGFYAFPGGQLDPSEDDRICAARELLEEVGVRVDPASLMDIGRWITPAFAPRRFDTRFFMTECPAGEEARIMTEEQELVWVTLPKTFEPLPRRWVVERTFAWIGRSRRMSSTTSTVAVPRAIRASTTWSGESCRSAILMKRKLVPQIVLSSR